MKKISIIILNFNGKTVLKDCLNSLQLIKVPKGYEVKIILVDNGSADNSQKEALEKFPKVVLVQNKTNLGFAKAINTGIKKALKFGSDFVMLLNNDTVVSPGFLSFLIKAIEKEKVGIVAPILKHQAGDKVQYDHGGQVNWLLGRTTHLNKPAVKLKKPTERDFVSGCCLLIKKEVIEKAGLLDESFFLYFEDADYCLRTRQAGFKVMIIPQAVIFHLLSVSTKKLIWHKFYHQLRSNFIFINKHQPLFFKPVGYFYLLALAVKIMINQLKND